MSVCWVSHAVAVATCHLQRSLLTFIFARCEGISHYCGTTVTFIFQPDTFKVLLQHLSDKVWSVKVHYGV